MHLSQPYKILDLDVTNSPLLDYDFVGLEWQPPRDRNHDYDFRETYDFPILLKGRLVHADNPLSKIVLKEVEYLEQYLNATAKIVVLNLLKPGCKIYDHIDPGDFFVTHHRVHLPLVTNASTSMTIDENKFHMKQGIWCEIDNTRMHSVSNESSTDSRIHLVVDLLPNK